MRKPAAISAEVFELLHQAVLVAESVDAPYAIGGAVGMAAHGYARTTANVDIFIGDKACAMVLHAFRDRGFMVQAAFEGIHYVATVPGDEDPDRRIDILIPYDDPEWTAVAMPDEVTMGGLTFDVFPPELLVLSKFYGVDAMHLGDDAMTRAKMQVYRGDIAMMLAQGGFDPKRVRDILRAMDPDKLPEWNAMMADFLRPHVPNKRPKRRPSC